MVHTSNAVYLGRQIRAARSLLAWNQTELARRAQISLPSVVDIERARRDSRTSTINAIMDALEKQGIAFVNGDDKHLGVSLRLKRRINNG